MTHAGELRDRVAVLRYERSGEGDWSWWPERAVWAKAEPDAKPSLFSSVGVGARGLTLTVREARWLSPALAFRYRGVLAFITSILPDATHPGYLSVRCALCDTRILTAKPQNRTGRDQLNRPVAVPQPEFEFEGILTERYYRNSADEISRALTLERVLVTPKGFTLRVGDIVADGERRYTVRQVLDLDAYKNEYILEAQEDA